MLDEGPLHRMQLAVGQPSPSIVVISVPRPPLPASCTRARAVRLRAPCRRRTRLGRSSFGSGQAQSVPQDVHQRARGSTSMTCDAPLTRNVISRSSSNLTLEMYLPVCPAAQISAHFAKIYGASVSKETISQITDKVLEKMSYWCSRPLDGVYAAILVDAVMVKVRDGQVANRPIYAAIGVTLAGERDILGRRCRPHSGDPAVIRRSRSAVRGQDCGCFLIRGPSHLTALMRARCAVASNGAGAAIPSETNRSWVFSVCL